MGRSTSINNSTAIDNRLAVTDNAFGLSSSGTNNTVQILDNGAINKAFDFAAFTGANSFDFARSVNNKSLDFANAQTDKALNFSAFSLSSLLDSVISGQKTAQQSSNYLANSAKQSAIYNATALSAAVRESALSSAQTTAYVGTALNNLSQTQQAAAEGQAAKDEEKSIAQKAALKKLAIGAGVLGVGWYLWKGRK